MSIFICMAAEAIHEKANVLFNIDAPSNIHSLAAIPVEKLTQSAPAQQALQQIFFRRLGEGSLRWNVSAYPTPARAQQAEMGYYAYQQFLYQAYALHLDDPAQYWREMAARQTRIVEWLMQRSHIEVKGQGIDLSFDCAGRNWYSAHGEWNCRV
jgi:aminopeptidase